MEQNKPLRVRTRVILLTGMLILMPLLFHRALPTGAFPDFLRSASFAALAMAGMGFIQSGGWVDLSCGCQMALVSALFLRLLAAGAPCWLAIVLSALCGVLCGVLNGVLIARVGLAPTASVIVTMLTAYGVAGALGSGAGEVTAPSFGLWPVVVTSAVFLSAAQVVFNRTFLGRYLLAVKYDEEAVRRSGVRTGSIAFAGFTAGALLFAVSALLYTGTHGAVRVTDALELDAVVIVGAHLSGVSASNQHSFSHTYSALMVLAAALILEGTSQVLSFYGAERHVFYVLCGAILALELRFPAKRLFMLHK